MQATYPIRSSFNILASEGFFVLQIWDQNSVFLPDISFCMRFSPNFLSNTQKTLIFTLNANIKTTTESLNNLYTQIDTFQYALSIANIYIHKQSFRRVSSSPIQIVLLFSWNFDHHRVLSYECPLEINTVDDLMNSF